MAEAPVCSRHGSPRSDATLRDIQINLLECKVCFEKFSTEQREYRPQNLSCGHVLCLECVRVLSHPLLRTLECPFCRQTCAVDSISHCQALTDLQEMLLSRSSQAPVPQQVRADSSSWVRGLSSGALRLGLVFGGWGTLINPTGIAVFGSSGTMVVVQDGDSRVVVFGPQGRRLHSFGQRGHAQDKICYPVDVAVTPTGYVVVTDAGDSAVKVYTSRGSPVLTVRESFQLPWGVDVDSCGHILVTDLQTGSLHQVTVDIGRGVTLSNRAVVTELQRPKAVACCRVTGNIAVVEQLDNPSKPTRGCRSTRLKVYNKDFKLFCQIDSFSLSLDSKVWLCLSAVAFDINGDVIVIDSLQDMIWSLGKLKSGPILTPLIRENLVRPVGLVATAQNSLIILDSGDHSVKMYSPISETTLAIKLTTMSSMHS